MGRRPYYNRQVKRTRGQGTRTKRKNRDTNRKSERKMTLRRKTERKEDKHKAEEL